MPSDRSRSSNDRRYNYTGVVTQQGRVILDRDFNALQQIVDGEIESGLLEVMGPCGTPDNGFAVSLPSVSPPGPPLWNPPSPLSPPGTEPRDFLVSPGTMYVGGQRVALPEVIQNGQIATYSYFDQPDWITPDPPVFTLPRFTGLRRLFEAVYLQLVEQEISAAEDPDLLDVALGGPDTTQRLRLMRYIRRLQTESDTCAAAWTDVVANFAGQGFTFDSPTMRLLPQGKLLVSFTQTQTTTDPCDPAATGGYLGEDNQLIRVQIITPGIPGSPSQSPTLAWAYDNASFIYRVAKMPAGATSNVNTLQFGSNPVDAFHTPLPGQLVEVLRTRAILVSEPDETAAPGSQSTIIRCVAEQVGQFFTLAARGYDPSSQTVVLNGTLPSAYANDPNPLFLRVWQGQLSFDPVNGTPVPLTDMTNQGTPPGLQVAITVPPNPSGQAVAPVGAYWMIAVRPSTPQGVYPERLLVEPQAPDGPRQWICPLAVIDWSAFGPLRFRAVTDCRQKFDNLVDLTKRRQGCCLVSVSASDVTGETTLQSIIDQAVTLGQTATVCLNPGVYNLDQPLRLGPQHAGLILESCGGSVTLEPDPAATTGVFADGLIVIEGASGVTLRGLSLTPASALMPQSAVAQMTSAASPLSTGDGFVSTISATIVMIGLNVVNSASLTVEDCNFSLNNPSGGSAAPVFGVNIFLRGDCSSLTVRRCVFNSSLTPTFNLPPFRRLAAGISLAANTPSALAVGSAPAAPSATVGAAQARISLSDAVLDPAVLKIFGPSDEGVASPPATVSPPALTSPPITSPPTLRSIELLRTERVNVNLGVLQADFAAAAVSAPQPMVITVGCLADFNLIAGTQTAQAGLACSLGSVSIRENSFSNLTLAVYAVADVTTARVQDNDATQCIGGFWFELADSIDPQGEVTNQQYTTVVNGIDNFRESLALPVLAENYPLPASSPAQSGSTGLITTTASFFITNNQIEALPPAAGQSTIALKLFANRALNQQSDNSASLIIASNRLVNQSKLQVVPTVLLTVADVDQCALTGNLIFNRPQQPGSVNSAAGSLIIIQNSNESAVQLLAVTGNALLGWTNLSALTRPKEALVPINSWLPHNAKEPEDQ